MRFLFCGDVVGRAGRDVVMQQIPLLKEQWKLDVIVVNADNAAAGFGVSSSIAGEFFGIGVNVITGGDHIWDQSDIKTYISKTPNLLRPHNFPDRAPGSGAVVQTLINGKKILVIHVLGQVFHKENLDCPFAAIDRAMEGYKLGHNIDAIIVDAHAEATSEKTAFGQYLDGKVSVVVGSHTHIPTADARTLPKGTAFQSDAGMCGDYNSVIGFDATSPIERFTTKMNKNRLQPAMGDGTLSGLFVEIDDTTGLATSTRAISIGGCLDRSADYADLES